PWRKPSRGQVDELDIHQLTPRPPLPLRSCRLSVFAHHSAHYQRTPGMLSFVGVESALRRMSINQDHAMGSYKGRSQNECAQFAAL
ncbi:hypothetical protein, partial [Candidatus Burkholderia verschuerenii]|uniref:hypothetical protein n=1 Tax=Candidatus Burkholderia verschuerenii TaxID=242163 RepID=UPI001E28B5C1